MVHETRAGTQVIGLRNAIPVQVEECVGSVVSRDDITRFPGLERVVHPPGKPRAFFRQRIAKKEYEKLSFLPQVKIYIAARLREGNDAAIRICRRRRANNMDR